MTEFMSQARLQEVAHVTEYPGLSPARLIPTLTWRIDADTGRPIGHWCLGRQDDASSIGS